MALVGRVTVLWILSSLFMLFVVLKLDGTTTWAWFLVFIPIWILDVFSIIYLIIFIVSDYRGNQLRAIEFNVSKLRKFWLICMFMLKMCFLLMLCAKLDGLVDTSLIYVFIPLWLLLIMLIVDSYVATWKEGKKQVRRKQPSRMGFT